jgi:ribosomal protein L18E
MSVRSILAMVLAALAFSSEASAKTQHAGAKAYNVSDATLSEDWARLIIGLHKL